VTPPHTGTCVWGCGHSNFNKEHILGEQILKRLALGSPVTMHWGAWHGPPKEKFQIVLKRRVCAGCNGGWLRRIDDAFVIPMDQALRTQAPVELDRSSQIIAATWANKVALLLELFIHDFAASRSDNAQTFVPDDNFPALRRNHGQPLSRTTVWIGAVRPGILPDFASHGAVRTVPVGDPRPLIRGEERGYYSMWSMRDIFFRVEGWEEGWRGPVPPAENYSPKLTQIWPVQRPVASWPGNYALTLDDVLDLSRPRIV
jgi:hypothetical protein